MFDRVAIVGVGLIGGSLGLALKRRGFGGRVEGYGRRISTLKRALELGAVDEISTEIERAGGADLVVICTPVEVIPSLAFRVASNAKAGCVITDVGSVKRRVVGEVERLFSQLDDPPRFVGGHPMAGSERRGIEAARADLFEGARCILTPSALSDDRSVERVRWMWEFVGCEVHLMSSERHDRLIAAASHLPHLSASALAETVGGVPEALRFAATGFKDSTRVAMGPPDMWAGILMSNADMIVPLIDELISSLSEYRELLSRGDPEGVRAKLERARRARESVG